MSCPDLSIIKATPATVVLGELDVIRVSPYCCCGYFVSGAVVVELRYACTIACMDVFIIVLLNRAMAWVISCYSSMCEFNV